MSAQPSPENILQDQLESFTDREHILSLLENALHTAKTGKLHLLAIKGNSGTGKTFLISYLIDCICPASQWQSGRISFMQSAPDFRTILLGLEDALKSCVPQASLKQYRAKREEYNRHFDDYKVAHRIGSIHLNMESSVQSSISNSPQRIQITTQLHERESHLRSEWSRALVELAEENEYSFCLFIDGYEHLAEEAPELTARLLEDVSPSLAKASPQPLLVVTSGWEWPANASLETFLKAELTDFDLEQMKSYLGKQNVLAIPADSSIPGQPELIDAFSNLTKGHPLALSIAVTFFNELEPHERTAQSLWADRPLVDERTRIEFLEERLLSRLQEPYRTLLEWGTILRIFDQASLQALLSEDLENVVNDVCKLDDKTYNRFLRFPFIRQLKMPRRDNAEIRFALHELLRLVGLSALRRHHPDTKEQLHRKMVGYYTKLAIAERESELARSRLSHRNGEVEVALNLDHTRWFTEMPEKEFTALLECLYHGLQVRESQSDTFDAWQVLIGRAVNTWRRRQAGSLLALVQQLVEEGEPFFERTSYPYGQYLIWYSKFLEQDARWEEAQKVLEQAAKIFEQREDFPNYAICLHNIGFNYQQQGKFDQALSYLERASAAFERVGNHADLVPSINNIGSIYYIQGRLDQALRYYEWALAPLLLLASTTLVRFIINREN